MGSIPIVLVHPMVPGYPLPWHPASEISGLKLWSIHALCIAKWLVVAVHPTDGWLHWLRVEQCRGFSLWSPWNQVNTNGDDIAQPVLTGNIERSTYRQVSCPIMAIPPFLCFGDHFTLVKSTFLDDKTSLLPMKTTFPSKKNTILCWIDGPSVNLHRSKGLSPLPPSRNISHSETPHRRVPQG